MEATKTFILECDRNNSVMVKALGITKANDRASWTNIVKPIQLQKGDQINLESVVISVRGAATQDSIEFSGTDSDNFSLLRIGFFIANQSTNNIVLPYVGGNNNSEYTFQSYTTDPYVEKEGMQYIQNNQGLPSNSQIWNNDPTGTLDKNLVKYPKALHSYNPHVRIDGTKFAKLDLGYKGWERANFFFNNLFRIVFILFYFILT